MLSKQAVYAGVMRSTFNDFNYKFLTRMDKVKSHQDETGLLGYEKWAAHCNNSIDKYADMARSCHFKYDKQELAFAKDCQDACEKHILGRHAIRRSIAALQQWPRHKRLTKQPVLAAAPARRPLQAQRDLDAAMGSHTWVYVRQSWICFQCGAQQLAGAHYSKAARLQCLGMPYIVKKILDDKVGTGHTFKILVTSKQNILVLCTTCGRWSSKTIRAGGLGSPCRHPQGRGANQRRAEDQLSLDRVAAGKHPHGSHRDDLVAALPFGALLSQLGLQGLTSGKAGLTTSSASGASLAPWTRPSAALAAPPWSLPGRLPACGAAPPAAAAS